MGKTYLSPEELLRLITDKKLCFISGAILAEGRQVGYMVRQTPVFPADSGWRFFAGGESGQLLRTGAAGFYPLNTLCNYDRQVIPLLDAPPGAAFMRNGAELVPLDVADPDGIAREINEPEKSRQTNLKPEAAQTGNAGGRTVYRIRPKKVRHCKRLYFPSPSDKMSGGTKRRKTEKTGGKRREIKFR